MILKVTLFGNDGCAVAGQLKEIIEGNVRVITGKVLYKGDVCPQVITPVLVNYIFKASTAGIYVLKFQKSEDTFIIHEIKVM
ncbi:MAG TPA: hypothetical protein VGD22_00410 [Sphingobacteriaceae bacterium]